MVDVVVVSSVDLWNGCAELKVPLSDNSEILLGAGTIVCTCDCDSACNLELELRDWEWDWE